ncbi:MAG: hypothetical protein HC833_11800 [Leptolyngbyaceae cyanobacterium RM1_406_9]|nr:hypothetical protein [Leptolyngbyaceae cyanobacterium RM1_406_9]
MVSCGAGILPAYLDGQDAHPTKGQKKLHIASLTRRQDLRLLEEVTDLSAAWLVVNAK